MLLVLLLGLAASHLLSVALYFNDRTSALIFAAGKQTGERITTIQRLMEQAPKADRQRIAEHADNPDLHVTWSEQSALKDRQFNSATPDVLRDALLAHLKNGAGRVFRLGYSDDSQAPVWQAHMREKPVSQRPGRTMLISLPLSDGSWLNFAAPVEAQSSFWSLRFVLSMGVMLLGVGIFSILAVRHLIRPLETFAAAAHRLGTDVGGPGIPEKGPAEIRQAIRAFNEMQNRIRRFVEDRTQMLAAISHDLGTPLTRLRLRAELVEDPDQREKMLADLDDMEKMVSLSLSFARDEATSEPHAMVDLTTLLQRVCDDAADAGHTVALDTGKTAVPFACGSVALRRALGNLIDNAIKYGHRARVSLTQYADNLVVTIEDDGPGIPEDRREDVFKPFIRLEESRSRDTGGTGLGLTVARTIIHAHGGEITLNNRKQGGLSVAVTLPGRSL